MSPEHRIAAAHLLVIAAFIVVGYWPSLAVPFVFDDFQNILLNPDVQPDRFLDLWAALDPAGYHGERLVAMFTFALNYLVSGQDPFSYHVVNIAIHIGNAFLLYSGVHLLASAPRSPTPLGSRAGPFAFAAALLWAVHPVNTQAVTYIVQRMASLAALFYLSALLLFILWRFGRLRPAAAWGGIILAFLLGMATKPHVITLPAALLLTDIVFFSGWRRWHAWALAGLAVAAVPVGWLFAGSAFEHLLTPAPWRGFSGVERLMTEGRVIWHYLSLLVWPDHSRLQLDYNFAISHSLIDPAATLWAWLALVGITVAAVLAVRKHPWPAFGWLFFGIAISVESSIILLEIAFEHRLYLPATMLIAGVVAPVYQRLQGERALACAGLAVVAVAGVLTLQTIERNSEWADQGRLWSADLTRGASIYRSALNGAIALARQGRPNDALALLNRIPEDISAFRAAKVAQNRGEILMMLGRQEDALREFRSVLAFAGGYRRAVYSAGQALLQLGRIDEAQSVLDQLQEHAPDNLYTHLLAAELMVTRDEPDAALESLRAYVQQHPELPGTTRRIFGLHIARALRELGHTEEAAREYRRIAAADRTFWAAWANLYYLLKASGETEPAARIKRYLDNHGVDPSAWASDASQTDSPVERHETGTNG